MHRRYQKTHEALQGFGEAVRAHTVEMEAPHLPPLRRRQFWVSIWNGLKTPVPVWIPSAAGVAVLLMFVVAIFSPLGPSIDLGGVKGGGTETVTPPLAAEAMLAFLIVPDPTDADQIAASIETVETFVEAYPEDIAMHAKLIELYQAKLKLKSLPKASRPILEKKLSIERARFIALLQKTELTKGTER